MNLNLSPLGVPTVHVWPRSAVEAFLQIRCFFRLGSGVLHLSLEPHNTPLANMFQKILEALETAAEVRAVVDDVEVPCESCLQQPNGYLVFKNFMPLAKSTDKGPGRSSYFAGEMR